MGNSSSDSTSTTVVSGVVVGLATICVALRFSVRIRTRAGISWDDWCILCSLLIMFLSGAIVLWSNVVDPIGAEAINSDSPNLNDARFITYLKLNYICTILYFPMITAIKISVLLMYHRIFSVDPSFRRQSFLAGIIVSVFGLATTVMSIADCAPAKYSWISLSDPKHCLNYNIFWMVTGTIDILIDSVILALPVRMVLGLQLSSRRKFLVSFIFLLGGFVVITGIVRTIYGYVPGSLVPSYNKTELWSTAHIGTAIACACLPTLRPLFLRASSTSTPPTPSSSARHRFLGLFRMGIKVESNSDGSEDQRVGDTAEMLPLWRLGL